MVFTEKLRVATNGKFQITTDGWGPYRDRVPCSLGIRANLATTVKVYQSDREGEARCAPPEVAATILTPIHGEPDPARVCTSHVELQNLSICMGMRRTNVRATGLTPQHPCSSQ